nr:PREDICTED: protein FAM173A [Bos mutus]
MTNKSAEWMSQCAYGPQPRPPHSILSSHSLGTHSSRFREPKTAATQPMPGRGAAAGGASTTRVGMKRGHNPQGFSGLIVVALDHTLWTMLKALRLKGPSARQGWDLTALAQRGGLGGGPHPHSPVFRVQVPYVGASARQVEHVLSLLRGRPGKTVDLGSGDGRIVLAAHRCGLRPAVGYELNPWLVGLARLRAWRAGCAGSVRYHREDLWKVSLRDCHNVSVFLAPSVLPLLEDKLQAELPAGARVVSGRFPLPTWQPVAVVGEGLDRVWAYDIHRGGPAGQAVPGPSSASVLGTPNSQNG